MAAAASPARTPKVRAPTSPTAGTSSDASDGLQRLGQRERSGEGEGAGEEIRVQRRVEDHLVRERRDGRSATMRAQSVHVRSSATGEVCWLEDEQGGAHKGRGEGQQQELAAERGVLARLAIDGQQEATVARAPAAPGARAAHSRTARRGKLASLARRAVDPRRVGRWCWRRRPSRPLARPPAHGPPLRRAREHWAEANVAGRDRHVGGRPDRQAGPPQRRRAAHAARLPASLIRYALDIPKGARLQLGAGIAPDKQDRPGTEFVVKLRHDGREDTVWSQLLDPVSRPAHRKWVAADIDLARFAGRGRELVLETRGYEQDADDPRRAFWAEPAITVPDGDAPLLVIYLVDTLRADHTTPYGYARDTTPELAAFAKDAVVFEQAIAQASWTKPAVASIFTSQLPGRHRAVQLRDTLDAGHTTLAEMLQAKGFATGAAIANSVIYGANTNFEQGFDFFAGLHGPGDRPSKAVDADVGGGRRALLPRRAPWLSPLPLRAHHGPPRAVRARRRPSTASSTRPPRPGVEAADPRSDYQEPADRDRIVAQYDGAVAFGDREFGRFVRELKSRGLYDRATIVFVADHGEEFLDHGQWTTGKTVFDELIRVPLLVKLPGGTSAGGRG